MAYAPPTLAQFKQQFVRDVPFAVPASGTGGDDTNPEAVQDGDINNAITAAAFNINPGLFVDQPSYTYAYNLLAAHYLCVNLSASSVGLSGQADWLNVAKAIGDVHNSFIIPYRIMKSPWMAAISKTTYGMQYLSIIEPLLVGNVMTVVRQTSPW